MIWNTSNSGVRFHWTTTLYRFYLMAMVWTIISLSCQVALLDITFGGEFIYMGYRLVIYLYSVYYTEQEGLVNPLHEYFPHVTGCTISGLAFTGVEMFEKDARCTMGLNPLYSVVNFLNLFTSMVVKNLIIYPRLFLYCGLAWLFLSLVPCLVCSWN